MQQKNATVAVIGAGEFIGGAIAKKFASEGFIVHAGRRNGEKLAPLVAEIEAAGGRVRTRSLDARKEADINAFLQRRGPRGAARSLHLQHRRQRQFSFAGHHGTGVSQGLGDGVLLGLSRRQGSGPADAAARSGRDFLHRSDRELARRFRFCGFRGGKVRLTRRRAKRGARARSQKYSCRASDHRFRRRHCLGARTDPATRRRRSS